MEKIIKKLLDFVIGPAVAIWLELPFIFMKLMNGLAWLINNRMNILAVTLFGGALIYMLFIAIVDPVGTLISFGTAIILLSAIFLIGLFFRFAENKIKMVSIWAENRVAKIKEEE
jgi:hypothetical protein